MFGVTLKTYLTAAALMALAGIEPAMARNVAGFLVQPGLILTGPEAGEGLSSDTQRVQDRDLVRKAIESLLTKPDLSWKKAAIIYQKTGFDRLSIVESRDQIAPDLAGCKIAGIVDLNHSESDGINFYLTQLDCDPTANAYPRVFLAAGMKQGALASIALNTSVIPVWRNQ